MAWTWSRLCPADWRCLVDVLPRLELGHHGQPAAGQTTAPRQVDITYLLFTPETGSTKYKVNPQDPLEKRLARLGHTKSAAETCSSPLLVLISCQSQKTSFTIRKIKHHKHELIIDFFGVPVLFPIYSSGSQHQLLHVNNWGLKDHYEHKGNGGRQG